MNKEDLNNSIKKHLDQYIETNKEKGRKFKGAKMFGKKPFYLEPIDYTFMVEDYSPKIPVYKIAVALLMKNKDGEEVIWYTYWFFRPEERNKWGFGGQNSLMLPKNSMFTFNKKVTEKWFGNF